MTLQSVAGNGFVVAGLLLMVTAAIGMVRLPDVYHRTNAVAKAAAFAVTLVLLGVLILMPSPRVAITVLLAIAAQLLTAPVAGYAVGRAARRSGAPLSPTTHRNDLG